MWNWYVDELILHERMTAVTGAIEHQRRIKAALKGQQYARRLHHRVAGVSSRMLVAIGNRLIIWGQHLEQPQQAC